MTQSAELVSRVVSQPRRPYGTGTVYFRGDGWIAKITLKDGTTRVRKRYTREDAEAAAEQLVAEFHDQLGWHYQSRAARGWFRDHVHTRRSRSGVTPRVRFRVLERDNFRCVYCGATPKQAELHVDHIVPVVRGGTDDPSNLATACSECNQGKADLDLAGVPHA